MATKTSNPLNYYQLESYYLTLSEIAQSFPSIPWLDSLINTLVSAMNEFCIPFSWDPELTAYVEKIRESNKPKDDDKDKETRTREIKQHKKDFPGEAKKIDDFIQAKNDKNVSHNVQLIFEPVPLSDLPEAATADQIESISFFIK